MQAMAHTVALPHVSICDLGTLINLLTCSSINDGETFYVTNLQADSASSEPPGKHGIYCVCRSAQSLSHIQLFATPQAIALQASLSMRFSRQEYWSVLPLPSPGLL